MTFEFKEETATNIEELKKMAAKKSDADLRLKAVAELGKWKCQQSIDILWRLMMHDLVYEVKHESFLRLQAFGENVTLPRKIKGNLIKQINKKIEKLIRTLEGQISFTEFIDAFQKAMPEEYDVYKHEKKTNFEKWLTNIINSLPADLRDKIMDKSV